ncbi:MAG: hypothetical protein M5U30_01740 [Burkholderiaceae bacterium]|nr:hypothetical protein [Burkholderiaceae bacterium]
MAGTCISTHNGSSVAIRYSGAACSTRWPTTACCFEHHACDRRAQHDLAAAAAHAGLFERAAPLQLLRLRLPRLRARRLQPRLRDQPLGEQLLVTLQAATRQFGLAVRLRDVALQFGGLRAAQHRQRLAGTHRIAHRDLQRLDQRRQRRSDQSLPRDRHDDLRRIARERSSLRAAGRLDADAQRLDLLRSERTAFVGRRLRRRRGGNRREEQKDGGFSAAECGRRHVEPRPDVVAARSSPGQPVRRSLAGGG